MDFWLYSKYDFRWGNKFIINADNYLQIDGLINILAAKLAHEMCNCDVEEQRRKFGIEGDMTEEEIAEYDNYPLD